jgi:hypothetical protein
MRIVESTGTRSPCLRTAREFQRTLPAIEAESAAEACELVEAVLGERVDFLFVPTPRRRVIYAGHDEYLTFPAHPESQPGGLVAALTAANYRKVEYVPTL